MASENPRTSPNMTKKLLPVLLLVLLISGCRQPTETSSSEPWWTDEDRAFILSELDRTTDELRSELASLTAEQWLFKEDSTRWSILEIVEHLEMQNQLHYREITVTSKAPEQSQYRSITEGQDERFTNYATDTTSGKASWFLEPRGKYASPEACENAFYKAREELSKFVEETKADLRKHVTYRNSVVGRDLNQLTIADVRDLHQLLLIGIAHTDRHLRQIRQIKTHENYPE